MNSGLDSGIESGSESGSDSGVESGVESGFERGFESGSEGASGKGAGSGNGAAVVAVAAGKVEEVELHEEAVQSYVSYAMSVIVGRALPDARDGLKPVHRRILYAMHELGLTSSKPFRKSARVVGEVLGRFHPHGDTAVYDALVRMAQDFSLRAPLVHGHGNFGSVDADPAAAMRYTECRLQPLTEKMLLEDIRSDTVDFAPNFDASTNEPTVLPARIPVLLLNGSQGIAVGMATNIPPHNLSELVDALSAFIDNPAITTEALMQICQGPDFPTGGVILGTSGMEEAYRTGRGSIVVRGRAYVEELGGGGAGSRGNRIGIVITEGWIVVRGRAYVEELGGGGAGSRGNRLGIVITELPYQTNKAALVEKMAELVNSKVVEGVSDIRDESDRGGMRVVVEVKRGATPMAVLASLYKHTQLQSRFNCNLVGLVNGEPKEMTLRDFFQVFLDFRCQVIERRTRFQLRKAEDREHYVQGLLIGLGSLDRMVEILRAAATPADAAATLQQALGLSPIQADALLSTPLRRLTSLEVSKLEEEHARLKADIADLQGLLASRKRILQTVKREAQALKDEFGGPRRTRIEADGSAGDLDPSDVIPNDTVLLPVLEGTAALPPPFNPSTPSVSHSSPHQIVPLQDSERITSMLPVGDFSEDAYLVMMTRGGFIKRTALHAFSDTRKSGLIAIQLGDGDELAWVRRATAGDSLLVGSQFGNIVRFACDDDQLRQSGRTARGVRAMRLREGDIVAALEIVPAVASESKDGGPWVVMATRNGMGKRVPTNLFANQRRGGVGVKGIKLGEGDALVALRLVGEGTADRDGTDTANGELLVGSDGGIINRLRVRDIPILSRTTRGCRLMRIAPGDSLASLSLVPGAAEGEEDDDGDGMPLVVPEGGVSDEEGGESEEEKVEGGSRVKAKAEQ
ncbi:unnamed protein product [Closterium sp. Yama58-4]|nr:unnamed protein product [Closterium sp. Yama58-4]